MISCVNRYFLLEEDNLAVAQRFLAAVQATVSKICQRPGIGVRKLIENPKLAGLRSWPVAGFTSIRIYYLVAGNTLRVIRVSAREKRYQSHVGK
jgi:plasmid stabilization system protein ParE